ncbi:MAG TPA: hypothetical protein VIL86_17680 [Tepidisphaeraceae bacterium]|jgi:hypothetical protein
MSGLNENHRRHVLITFQTLDEMFERSEEIIASSRSGSPFRQYVADITPRELGAIAEGARQVRAAMTRILPRLGITAPSPSISAAWAIYMAFAMASGEAVEELRPRRMRGYGEVPSEAAAELEACVTELQAILNRTAASLGSPGRGDAEKPEPNNDE